MLPAKEPIPRPKHTKTPPTNAGRSRLSFKIFWNNYKIIGSYTGNKGGEIMDNLVRVVALFRISVDKKKKKGNKKYTPNTLGIQAQEVMVHNVFSEKHGYKIVKEFYEQGSGRKKHRPVLTEALEYCKKNKCMLVVARQDRLTRRVVVMAMMLEGEVDFRVAIYPDLDPKENEVIFLTQSMFDQIEGTMISRRTEAAMQIKKAKGEKMGQYGKNILSKRNHEKSITFSLSKEKILTKLINVDGITTYNGLAKALNKLGEPTYFDDGHFWSAKTVRHVIQVVERETGKIFLKSRKRKKIKTRKK